MAKKPTQASKEAVPAGNGQAPSLNVMAQYIKDLSFENPGAPISLQPRETAPEINININVNANPLAETDYEVEIRLEAKATAGEDVLFNVELQYGGVFRIIGVPQDSIHPVVLIECPRLLFPYARQIVSDTTRNGGFPPLMIDPVDFAQLYQNRLAEQQTQPAPTADA